MVLSTRKYPILVLVIPAGIFLLCAILSLFQLPRAVYQGITVDLIILAPALYFLAVRKTRIPNITVFPVLVAGTLIGGLILPEESRENFDLLTSIMLPVGELIILGVIGFYSYRTIKAIRSSRSQTLDFFQVFEQSVSTFIPFPKVAKILSLEIGGIYYALFVWKKHKLKPNEFSYQSETGLKAILYAVIGVTIVEAVVVHILIAQWNTSIAWLVTVLSVYGGLMILAQIKSMAHRPHIFRQQTIELKNGIFGYAKIPVDYIQHVEVTSRDLNDEEDAQKLAFLGSLESHNICLHFNRTIEIEGPYGIRKRCNSLYIHVDKPEVFSETITGTC